MYILASGSFKKLQPAFPKGKNDVGIQRFVLNHL